MKEIYERTSRLIGDDALEKIRNANILLFGLGGVGGYVAEALCRAGIGNIAIVDCDFVESSNINRQIIATRKTIGASKAEVFKKRIDAINSEINVEAHHIKYCENTRAQFDFTKYDYIVDAIDDVPAKIDIICRAKAENVKIISSMGTGNKLNDRLLQIDDIHNTKICPLAKAVRKELKKRDVKGVKVVYSTEEPIKKQSPPGTISYVPAVAGLMIAGEVIRDIIGM